MTMRASFAWLLTLVLSLNAAPSWALDGLPETGDAIVTKFSGAKDVTASDGTRQWQIDADGAVAKVLDLQTPEQADSGEPASQQPLVTAGQVGEIFGAATDDAIPANIYLSASAIHGLARTDDGWMEGQWGPGGGPGTIWKLDAANGYQPEIFADVTLAGRENSGASLGNIAYDPYHRQLLVSDLETGMIHAFGIDDGVERDRFDHGLHARSGFLDAATGEVRALPVVEFDPATTAQIEDCAAGPFVSTPQCWNLADFRRRVWGLAVRRDTGTGAVRAYYAVWSDTGFSNPDFEAASPEDKTNAIWSVELNAVGQFKPTTARREFVVPGDPVEGEGAANRFAISDIAFPRTVDQRTLALARNRGLIVTEDASGMQSWPAFDRPAYRGRETQRWVLDDGGQWNPATADDEPVVQAVIGASGRPSSLPIGQDAAGGVDFGFGYRNGQIDPDAPAGTVWHSADNLCAEPDSCEPESPQPAAEGAEPPVIPDIALDSGDMAQLGDVEIIAPYPAAGEWQLAGDPDWMEGGEQDWWPPEAQGQDWWPAQQPLAAPAAGPDLALQKAVPQPCFPGKTCSIVLVVTNVGDQPYTGALRLADGLANDWALASGGPAGSLWSCNQFGAEASCIHPGLLLEPGQSEVVAFDVKIPANQVPGIINNCAVIQHGQGAIDVNPANDEGCAQLTFDNPQQALPYDLAITKEAQGECAAGKPCLFALRITNNGTANFAGTVSYVDIMPAGWTFTAVKPGWWCMLTVGGGDRFSCWRQANLAPGQSVVSLFTTTPPGTFTGTVDNCAEIDWSKAVQDQRADNDRACVSVTLREPEPVQGVDLKIEKRFVHPALTGPLATANTDCRVGDACPFGFEVTITNAGTETYFGPIIFDDLMPLAWTYEGASGAQICQTKGAFLSCGFGPPRNLAPGESVKASVMLRSAPVDKPGAFVVRNCAALSLKMQGDQNSANDSDCDELTAVVTDGQQSGTPVIKVVKSATTPCLYNVEACRFTISLRNEGTADFDGGVLLADKWLPGGWILTPPADWKCSQPEPDVWNCGAWVKVPAGQTIETQWSFQAPAGFNPSGNPVVHDNCILPDTCVSITLETGRKVGPVTPGQTVSSSPGNISVGTGGQTGGGQQQAAGETADILGGEESGPDLKINKNLLTTCEPGKRCDFVLNVTGVGSNVYKGKFTVTDTLPAGWSFAGGGTQGLWSCAKAGASTVCTYDAFKSKFFPTSGFDSSETLGFGLQLNIPSNQPDGIVENCAAINFLETPPANGKDANHKSCVNVVIGHPPKLTITKRFDKALCVPGESCDFTITVRNEGKGAYEGLLEIWDHSDSADGIEVKKIDADPALNCGREGTLEVLLCTTNTPLKPGESRTIRVSATISQMWAGSNASLENCARIELYDTDPTSWSYEKKLSFVRSLLIAEKQMTHDLLSEPDTPLNIAEIAAVMAYKKDQGIKGSNGKLDETGEITDAMLESALPTFRDAAFDDDTLERTTDGTIIREACSTVSLRPNLKITKTGPSDVELTGGSKAGHECRFDHLCAFTISVSATNGQPYDGPITLREELPTGWKLDNWFPKAPGGWTCQGSNPAICTIADAHIPAGGSIQLDLSIRATPAWYQHVDAQTQLTVSERRHPWIVNCSYVQVENQVLKQAPHASCYRARLSMADLSNIDYDAIGTGTCTPPGCTFYQFTATVREEAYRGPLRIDGTLPAGSQFPKPVISSTASGCLPSAWSCSTPQATGFTCRADDCFVQPGEQIAVRLEGSVAPDLKEPPETPLEKTACSTIEWIRKSSPGSIEQQPGPMRKRACFTTTILAKPRPEPCPDGLERNAAGRCVPIVKPLDLAIAKRTVGNCDGQENCRFQITVSNQNNTPFNGRIAIRDTLSVAGATLNRVSGRASCTQSGQTIDCVVEPGAVVAGRGQVLSVLSLDMTLPRRGGNRSAENCVEIYRPDAGDLRLSRDDIRTLQRTLDQLGYDPGPIDGIMGRKTRDAANAAIANLNLSPGTRIDRALLSKLLGGGAEAEDINPANDRACVSVVLPECRPGFTHMRGSGECVCPSPMVERDGECVIVAPPQPSPIICEGGSVDSRNRCICPSGWNRQRLARDHYRCSPPPQPSPVICEGGSVDSRNQCICPRGWNRQRLARDHYRCNPPPQPSPIICEGGRVDNRNQCVCPRGWNRQTLARDHYRCSPPQVSPVVCEGGRVDNRNQCICPRGWNRQRLARNHYRCLPAPAPVPTPVPNRPTPVPAQPQCIGGTMVRGICVCPTGMARIPLPNNAGFSCMRLQMIRPQPVPVPIR
ncbi:peptidoglycan-binding protein [Zhengella sp. ZM62]|uniref:peptidoglycan-binding protein n=1 Tax=Zhengella sedimenti TaxID=3390035 RepID=UPI003976FC46